MPLGASCGTDFDKVAVDGNAIYVHAKANNPCKTVAALPKAPFTNGTAQVVQDSFTLSTALIRPFSAINFDPVSSSDPVWFIAQVGTELQYQLLTDIRII